MGNTELIDKQKSLEKEIKKKEDTEKSHLLDIKQLTQKCEEQRKRESRIKSLEHELSIEKPKTVNTEVGKKIGNLLTGRH